MDVSRRFYIPALVFVVLLVKSVQATPYWSPSDVAQWSPEAGHVPASDLGGGLGDGTPPSADAERAGKAGGPVGPGGTAAPVPFHRLRGWPDTEEYREALGRVASYLERWQVASPQDPRFGGVREAEHMPEIVQTDNTSEAIWVWSRQRQLSGEPTYFGNIQNAFAYCLHHPAYLEEGGSTPQYGYYRMYNCAWAVLAEQTYRDAYDDDSYRAYADSCARYIRDHTLVRPPAGFYGYVNPPVYAWALGNLYEAGVRRGISEWCEIAAEEAAEVRAWVEAEPTLLAAEAWAMSGGATLWGLLQSHFRAHPESAADWLSLYVDQLPEWADPGAYENGWNAWYALAHWVTAEHLDPGHHYDVHAALTAALIAEDGDQDGGIPGSTADSDEMDQSWVSSALAFMGCNPPLLPLADVSDPRRGADRREVAAQPRLLLGPSPACGSLRCACETYAAAEIRLGIHDLTGRRVADLAAGRHAAGYHEFRWDGRDASGHALPAGTYWVCLVANGRAEARGFVWVR